MNSRSISVCRMLCIVAVAVPCKAQRPKPPQEAIQQLQSADPVARARAFEALRKTPATLAAPGMATVLLRLLNRENDLIAATLRESNGASGVSEKYGEGYSEYETDLLEACLQYCDKQGVLQLMVQNTHSDVSAVRHDAVRVLGDVANRGFSQRQRAVIDSVVLGAAKDASWFLRGAAIYALGGIVEADRALSDERRTRIHGAVIAATADTIADVRLAAVRVLSNVGDPTDIALLRRLAERDTARSVTGGRQSYPVREAARRAMAKIAPP